jgi:flagellar biosynthesis/type III secretory pathway M-ring protein FliF/YscJ
MDLFNRAYAPLNDLFRSMTPGSRLTTALLLLVVIASVGYLFVHPMPATTIDLMHGEPIARGQLPKMLAAFKKANLTTYELQSGRILVPRGEEAAYSLALVDAKALPPGLGEAQGEAMNGGSLFDIGTQRDRDRAKYAWQKDVSVAIEAIPGVEKAWFQYDEERTPGLGREKQAAAVAFVKPVGSAPLEMNQIKKIHDIVLACKVGLDHNHVTVADLNGDTWRGDIDASLSNNRLYAVRGGYEEYLEKNLKAKILGILSYIPNITVEVNVELDRPREPQRRPTQRDIAAAAPEKCQAVALNGSHSASQPASSATAVLDALLNSAPAANHDAACTNALEPANEPPDRERTPPATKCARVSINVPWSYFREVCRKRRGGTEGIASQAADGGELEQLRREETEKIQASVAQLLPLTESNASPANSVTVTPFEESLGNETSQTAWRQEALTWLRRHGGMAALVGLSLVSVLVLRMMAREGIAELHSAPSLRVVSASPAGEAPATKQEELLSDSNHAAESGGVKRRKDLAESVRRDPHAAAAVLRTWVGNSG